jgi:hypothetical protein
MEEELARQYIGETVWIKLKVKFMGIEITREIEDE